MSDTHPAPRSLALRPAQGGSNPRPGPRPTRSRPRLDPPPRIDALLGWILAVCVWLLPSAQAQVAGSIEIYPGNSRIEIGSSRPFSAYVPILPNLVIRSTSGATGWAARAADAVHSLNAGSSFPQSISDTGPALFCTGSIVQSASLLLGYNLDVNGMQLWPQTAGIARRTGLQQVLEFDSGLALVQAANHVRKDALSLNALMSGATATVNTVFPGGSLGSQLQQVAKLIKLSDTTGLRRQVFFCSLGGFHTHGSQSWQHWDLLRQVAEALAAFHNATLELGMEDRVTTFTLSDFGRTLQPSGAESDHGWGNHHLVPGGAVLGGNVYGHFPEPALGGPDDSGSRGALIPGTSIDQYGATLASWFGVPADQLAIVFPNLPKFPTANLGFLG